MRLASQTSLIFGLLSLSALAASRVDWTMVGGDCLAGTAVGMAMLLVVRKAEADEPSE